MSADSRPAAPEDLVRLGLLARLVPSVVHELNNSLTILRGVLELLVQDTGDPSGRRAIEETISAHGLLIRLSAFAKDDEEATTAVDAEAVLVELGPLLRAFAKSHGVALELDGRPGRAFVGARPRTLARLLACVVLLLLRDARCEHTTARVHVDARTSAGALVLRFAGTHPPRGGPADADVEAVLSALHATLVEAPAAAPRIVRRPGAFGLRLCLAADVLEVSGESDERVRGTRVLLLGVGAPHEDELAELLREAGYVVRHRGPGADVGRTLEAAVAEVALVDESLLAESPSLLARVLSSCDRRDPRIVLLGLGSRLERVPAVPNPCPPDELLRAVAAAAEVHDDDA